MVLAPVVRGLHLLCMVVGVSIEGLHPLLEDAVALFRIFHPVDGFLELVHGLKVVALGVDEGLLIADMEEQLRKKLVGRHRDEGPDVVHQLLDIFIGVSKKDKLGPHDDLESDYADAPEVPVWRCKPRQRVDVEELVVVGHPHDWVAEDGLIMVGQGGDVREGHLLAGRIHEDGGGRQGSGGDLGRLELGVHEDQLPDENVASSSHQSSLRQQLPQPIFLASDLEAEPVVDLVEARECGNEHVLPLVGRLRQTYRCDDLMRVELLLKVVVRPPGLKAIVVAVVELPREPTVHVSGQLQWLSSLSEDVKLEPVEDPPLVDGGLLDYAVDGQTLVDAGEVKGRPAVHDAEDELPPLGHDDLVHDGLSELGKEGGAE